MGYREDLSVPIRAGLTGFIICLMLVLGLLYSHMPRPETTNFDSVPVFEFKCDSQATYVLPYPGRISTDMEELKRYGQEFCDTLQFVEIGR